MNSALQNEVAAAVAAAPPGSSRKFVVDQFLGRGASRASLYAWVDRAISGEAMQRIKGPHEATLDIDRRVLRGMSAEKTTSPIEFQAILRELVDDTQMLRAMAKNEDGTIKMPRLLLEAIDKAGRTLDRAARIAVILQDVQAQSDFLRDLADVIYKEEPAVRERIVGKMRQLGHGSFV